MCPIGNWPCLYRRFLGDRDPCVPGICIKRRNLFSVSWRVHAIIHSEDKVSVTNQDGIQMSLINAETPTPIWFWDQYHQEPPLVLCWFNEIFLEQWSDILLDCRPNRWTCVVWPMSAEHSARRGCELILHCVKLSQPTIPCQTMFVQHSFW